MNRARVCCGMLALLAALCGCTSMSVGPQAGGPVPRIEGAPGKAVIYLVRGRPDISLLTSTLTLDGQVIGSTHQGTYMRLEVSPGRHRIAGYAEDIGAINLDVAADRIYFVQQSVSGGRQTLNPLSFFTSLSEARGRALMAGAVNAQG